MSEKVKLESKHYDFEVTIENQGAKEKEFAHFYKPEDLGKKKEMKVSIDFFESGAFAYGNRYAMSVEINDDISTRQIYDIRYDTSFHINDARNYALDFISQNWSGEQGSWKAIDVKEIIKEQEQIEVEQEQDER